VACPTKNDLTPVELLVLDHAGGDNDTGVAYGVVQLYAVFESENEMLEATHAALLRLFDLGLVRFVEATREVGYTADRRDLPEIGRDGLVAKFERDRDLQATDSFVFYDLTPSGEALLDSVPRDRIPEVSGTVRRPWRE
jgi:hypothetical protein